ncbi:unnamed protein product [Penicillium salamii]|uniref:Autophagy-related protein 6 n=1 Tax=Penicillium salamii TaxID=1612424 RepID=A0A9W4NBG5_9EURO|nr:unnamed protein product [Penicillium salamii]CAG8026876.1 unnamed protein product [Penicillium salamii]CAG8037344.1 unnamed protein product [Penicillium salamii]CAG8059290.1 unnamed protein product [Penicillium salamii]CAG8087148.1 unnamed protein product [Penicillium salamii]
MGWFSGNSQNDPVQKLDPGLRDYLEQEKPDKYVPGPNVKPPSTPEQSPEPSDPSKPKVPSASLYQDGRYADLWKTYKPPTVDDGEQVGIRGASRVIEKHKEHGDTVQRAAMENCALEHEALTYCFQTGNWRKQIEARLTLCSAENSTFSRCFMTQTKFLQALGYAANFEQDAEKEERIQLHADKLYHQMLDYEKRIEEAKSAGLEPPPLASLFHPEKQSTVQQSQGIEIPGGEAIPAGFKPSKPLQKLTPHERELEIRAHNAQLEQQRLYVEEATPFMKSQDDARQKRQEKAVSWFGETLGKWMS